MSDSLLLHPGLEHWNPARYTLVRMGAPLSARLNCFVDDGVVLTPALSTFNSKVPVAYELILNGIRSGKITRQTRVVAASSGNTGLDIAQLCKMLGIPCIIIMQDDTPPPKIGAVTVLGSPVDTLILSSGTVARAREMASLPGHHDVDQYDMERGNLEAQYKYFVPQLYTQNPAGIDVMVVPGGTLGTIGALKKYVQVYGLSTKLVLALCAPGEEVPGARDVTRIRRDVRGISVEDFEYMCGTRLDSFLASYAMFPEVAWMPGGPTSGLALLVALRFVHMHKVAGTLGQFRGKDGKIRVVFLCPDSYLLYADLYRSILNGERDFIEGYISVERLLRQAA